VTKSAVPFVFLLALIAATATWLSFRYEKVQQGEVINSDGYGYYAYLPARFIYHSSDFSFIDDLSYEESLRYWVSEGLEGKYLPKMSMGLAYLWTPGFLAAHWVAGFMGYPQDGWSEPYQLAVLLTSVLFLVLGLFFIWNWLRNLVSPIIALVSIALLFLATNLMHYSGPQASFTHVYSFALIAIACWLTAQWLETPKSWHYVLFGLLFGLIVLIRPTNGIFALLPFLLVVLKGRWKSHLLNPATLLSVVFALLPWIPQLFFWKETTGQWLHYSYGEEAIFWLSPHIVDGLFSYRNGWFVYTPVMLAAALGFIALWRRDRSWGIAAGAVMTIHIYIVFSWWCWYYGDSLSIRPMVDSYAVMALPMAMMLQWTWKQSRWTWPLMVAASALLIWNNWLQTEQYNKGLISGSQMTGKAFHALFFNTNPPKHLGVIGAYQIADNDRLRLGLPERTMRDTIVERILINATFDVGNLAEGRSGRGSRLAGDYIYSDAYTVRGEHFETPFDRTMRAQVWVKHPDFDEIDAYLVLSFEEGEKIYGYHTVEMQHLDLKDGEWNRVDLFIRKPEYLPDSGFAKTYVWLKEGDELWIDDLRLEQIDCPYSEEL